MNCVGKSSQSFLNGGTWLHSLNWQTLAFLWEPCPYNHMVRGNLRIHWLGNFTRSIYKHIYMVYLWERIRIESGMLVSRQSIIHCSSSWRPGVWKRSSYMTDKTFIIIHVSLRLNIGALIECLPAGRTWCRDDWQATKSLWESWEVCPLYHCCPTRN